LFVITMHLVVESARMGVDIVNNILCRYGGHILLPGDMVSMNGSDDASVIAVIHKGWN